MAVYKVPQDVEAEDKFLGPLTFKQFLFFGGALVTGFLMYQVIAAGVAFLIILILPIFIVCVTLAFPWTKDQPTELWLASRIRFLLVQHKRIWDQDNVKELVTITAPVRIVHMYTDGLSQYQVKSRLNALANVIDTKGWAIQYYKNGQPVPTDRLTGGSYSARTALAQHDQPDLYDDQSSTIAQQFDSMIQQSTERRLKDTKEKMTQALNQQFAAVQQSQPQPASNNPWFLQQGHSNDAGMTKFQDNFEESLSEQQFLDKVHKKQEEDAKAAQLSGQGLKTIQPLGAQQPGPGAASGTAQTSVMPTQTQPAQQPIQSAQATSPQPVDPAILALAQNDDLDIATIARQANREISLQGDGEVVISLHDGDHR